MIKSDSFSPAIKTPSFARRLDVYEVERVHSRFWSLVSERHVRYRENRCYPLYGARPNAGSRILPDVFRPLKETGGWSQEEAMKRFFMEYAGPLVSVWPEGYSHCGTFSGFYSDKFLSWVDRSLVFGPAFIMSQDRDMALVVDRDLRFSTAIATEQVIMDFDKCFGGRDRIEKNFLAYVEKGGVGEGVDDLDWVVRELMSSGACGETEVHRI